jgi:threonine synthase
LTETKGRVLVIEEEEILKSQQILSHMGFFIEPTSALALAGFLQMKTEIGEKEIVVLPLTGSGLKGHPSNH